MPPVISRSNIQALRSLRIYLCLSEYIFALVVHSIQLMGTNLVSKFAVSAYGCVCVCVCERVCLFDCVLRAYIQQTVGARSSGMVRVHVHVRVRVCVYVCVHGCG